MLRDVLAARIKSMLEDVEFNGQSIDGVQAQWIIRAGQALFDRASDCSFDPRRCGV
jgi:hypothetical protein